jgi:hypothetical protein
LNFLLVRAAQEFLRNFNFRDAARRITAATLVVSLSGVAGFLAGCKKKEAEGGGQQTHVDLPKLSDAEFKFGVSPTKNSKVTYQPDAIVVEHGADAIRSANSDGISVTIDPNLPEAAQMEPGKVVFLTSRAAGRILGTEKGADGLRIFLGPAEITDFIQEGDFNTDQPLDLNSMIAYTAPDFPGAEVDAPKLTRAIVPEKLGEHTSVVAVSMITPSGEWRPLRGTRYSLSDSPNAAADPAVWTSHDIASIQKLAVSGGMGALGQLPNPGTLPKVPAPPPVPGIPSTINLSEFKLSPFCCGGIGLKIEYNKAGLIVKALAVIKLANPKLHFDLNISGGKVQKAGVTLDGAAGLLMQFETGISAPTDSAINNAGKEIAIPCDFSVPILGLPVPFAVTLRQAFILKTAFSARTGTLKATGDYSFNGSFFMGYKDGQWTVSAPAEFHVNQSLINTIEGVSVGVNGIVLAYQGKVMVGIGAFGFATGPYLGYNASVGFSRGSDLAGNLPRCKGATLDIQMAVGIGYSIPQPVTSAINLVLRTLNMKEIQGSGGLEHRETILNKEQYDPPSCGKP